MSTSTRAPPRQPRREPAGAVAAVTRMLTDAAARGASDLHLDPGPGGLRVRARIDGLLCEAPTLPADVAAQVVGRLKALSGLLAYRTDVPQEGRIAADRSPTGGELRVATYPTLDGERAAIRFDTADAGATSIDDLGLPPAALHGLRAALERPDGVILLTGPSGSGKTTTLYACLRHLVATSPGRSLLTLEDPVAIFHESLAAMCRSGVPCRGPSPSSRPTCGAARCWTPCAGWRRTSQPESRSRLRTGGTPAPFLPRTPRSSPRVPPPATCPERSPRSRVTHSAGHRWPPRCATRCGPRW